MGYYFHRSPNWLQNLYPGLSWKADNQDKTLYLTFDDGPVPEVTPYVLDVLNKHSVKATFFCVGHNIEKHPNVFESVVAQGHAVGNHTYNHLVGWNESLEAYKNNVAQCDEIINTYYRPSSNKKLFRPPHGRITRKQIKALQHEYEIVMWTYLTGDFDPRLSSEKCLNKILTSIHDHDIIVFHDSFKAKEKMQHCLSTMIDHYHRKGFTFKTL